MATVATALGSDILKYIIQSRAPQSQVTEFGGGCALHCSGPPALRVAGLVTPSQASCGESCCCLLFPLCLPENWVEAEGRLFFGKGVPFCLPGGAPDSQEMFSCEKGEVVISQLPGERWKEVGSSEHPLSSKNPSVLLIIV